MRRMERMRGEQERQDPRTLPEIARICENPIVRCLEELPCLTSR